MTKHVKQPYPQFPPTEKGAVPGRYSLLSIENQSQSTQHLPIRTEKRDSAAV